MLTWGGDCRAIRGGGDSIESITVFYQCSNPPNDFQRSEGFETEWRLEGAGAERSGVEAISVDLGGCQVGRTLEREEMGWWRVRVCVMLLPVLPRQKGSRMALVEASPPTRSATGAALLLEVNF